ncbi:MAG TPA: phosphatase PAP2 family protein [Saprospiraceae bacterium]|nr:phosphatase PAP2 family protein [Saprospiraceae bacterium]
MLDWLNLVDHKIFEWVQIHMRSAFADPVFLAFRDKHFWIPFYVFLISLLVFQYRRNAWKILILAIVTIAITDQLNSSVLKNYFQRERPCQEEYFKDQFTPVIGCSRGMSFPSSHATNHMGVAGLLFFTCKPVFGRWRWLLLAWAGLVGFSQIYIGVHFPFDILAGCVEGFAVSYLVFVLAKPFIREFQPEPVREKPVVSN